MVVEDLGAAAKGMKEIVFADHQPAVGGNPPGRRPGATLRATRQIAAFLAQDL